MDGKDFVGFAVREAWERPFPAYVPKPAKAKPNKSADVSSDNKAHQEAAAQAPAEERSRLIDHFVMNLPDSAITFLGYYRGIYKPLWETDESFREAVKAKGQLPLVHCYCFTRMVEGGHEEDIREVRPDLFAESMLPTKS